MERQISVLFGISKHQSVNLRTWNAPFYGTQNDFPLIFSFIKKRHKELTTRDIELKVKKLDDNLYRLDYGSEMYSYYVVVK